MCSIKDVELRGWMMGICINDIERAGITQLHLGRNQKTR
jgi:hypothetical protein